jgi:hypothetical protein
MPKTWGAAMAWFQRVLRGAVILPTLAAAQQPLELAKPNAAYAEPFTQVASIRELRDGRVLVLDRRDRLVLLVDMRKGTAQRVGREGTGPGEYTQPGRLFALPADTTAIYDGPSRRFVLAGPDGKTGDAFRLDLATGGGQRRGGVPKWGDAEGRVFTEGSPYAAGELRAADSTAIARFDRAARSGDTLAWVHLDKETIQIRNLPDGGASVSNGVRAFASRDDWVALPDGGVAVVRVADYHVDWYSSSGERVAGPIVKADRLPLSEADKARARKERLAAMRSAMPRNGGIAGPPPPTDPVGLPDLTFPPVKPPFEVGNVFARPNGEVWVLRSRRVADPIAMYDVFTRGAGLIGRVAFPPRTRLIGFGNATVYAVRLDEDDLQYLERWTLPYETRLWGAGR